MVLSMLLTPLIIQHSNTIVMKLYAQDWLMQSVQPSRPSPEEHPARPHHHLRLCTQRPKPGSAAGGERMPYIWRSTSTRLRAPGRRRRLSVVFGDAAKIQSLMAAGWRAPARGGQLPRHALGAEDPALVQAHAPHVPVVVRTIDDSDLEKPGRQVPPRVVPEAIEGSFDAGLHALALVGAHAPRDPHHPRRARRALRPLRGYFHGADDGSDEVEQAAAQRHPAARQHLGRPGWARWHCMPPA